MRCDAPLPTPRPNRATTPPTSARPKECSFFGVFVLRGEPAWDPEAARFGDSGITGNLLRSLPPKLSSRSGAVLVRSPEGASVALTPAFSDAAPSFTFPSSSKLSRRAPKEASHRTASPSPRTPSTPFGSELEPASSPVPACAPEAPTATASSSSTWVSSCTSPVNSHAAFITAVKSTVLPTTSASCAATPVTKFGSPDSFSIPISRVLPLNASSFPPFFDSLSLSMRWLAYGLRLPPTDAAPPASSAAAALAAAAASAECGPCPSSLSIPSPASSLRSAPKMGAPMPAFSMESQMSFSCEASLVLFRMTPAIGSSSSKARWPLRSAAADRAGSPSQSRTRTTGAPSHLASCPVLPSSSPKVPS
mmetsp:Transcript_8788/g.39995  ORF Transcript_8788/g.39995 Transcript_8788/m.39995 type:complete len:364 (+) Transcript_8788:4639-5730(+)